MGSGEKLYGYISQKYMKRGQFFGSVTFGYVL